MGIDIAELTAEAEKGNGCAVATALSAQPFEDSLKTMEQISALNAKDRAANPDLPEIWFNDNGYEYNVFATLNAIAPGAWISRPLLEEQLVLSQSGYGTAGQRKYDCKTIDFGTK